MRRAYQTDLSDAEWSYIEPHLPAPEAPGRPRLHPLREILAAIFYIARSGCACSLVLIAQSIPSPPKGPARLTKPVIPDYGFELPGECLKRVMHSGENRIEMRITRSGWLLHDFRFPHS
jgi:hypothetical protein